MPMPGYLQPLGKVAGSFRVAWRRWETAVLGINLRVGTLTRLFPVIVVHWSRRRQRFRWRVTPNRTQLARQGS